jgi:predicted NACHT family NTPase
LLHQWDVERELVEEPKTIDYKDKQAMLRQVAYRMQANEKGLAGNLIGADSLEDILTDYLKKKEFSDPRDKARRIIHQLQTRNFILCVLGADYYAFVHRTFLEYFCAWEFVWQFEKTQNLTIAGLIEETFSKHWQDESWQEVLCLIAGMIEAKFVGEILEYLMGQDGEKEKFINLFLAAKCLSEVRNRTGISPTATQLLNRLKGLTKYDLNYYSDPNSSEYEKEWQLVAEIRTKSVVAVATVWQEDSDTLTWLQARAQSDDDSDVRQAAVEEIARGWKEHPDTLPMLQARAQSDDNPSVRRAAVQEIARGWKEHPDTLPMLQARAQSDDNPSVRRAAVQEIARGWKEHPDTLPMLQALAQSDDHWTVQKVAVEEIARGWKEHPDTLTWLQALAQSDGHWAMRRAAVEEIARGWKEHPDTLPMLQALAQSDNNLFVRRAAVQEIARGWKEHPDTLAWLQALAQSDDHWGVREAAVEELARGWKDNPGMWEFLRDRAINDPFIRDYDWEDNPRQTALEVIVQQYPHHPQTLSLLRDRAIKDPDEKVREFANQSILKYQEPSQ